MRKVYISSAGYRDMKQTTIALHYHHQSTHEDKEQKCEKKQTLVIL